MQKMHTIIKPALVVGINHNSFQISINIQNIIRFYSSFIKKKVGLNIPTKYELISNVFWYMMD